MNKHALKIVGATTIFSMAACLAGSSAYASGSTTELIAQPTAHGKTAAETAYKQFPHLASIAQQAGKLSAREVEVAFASPEAQAELATAQQLRGDSTATFWPLVVIAGEALITFATTSGLRLALAAAVRGGWAAFNAWMKANPAAAAVVNGAIGAAARDIYEYIKSKLG